LLKVILDIMLKRFSIHALCWFAFATTRLFREAQVDLSPPALLETLSFMGPTLLLFYGSAYLLAPLLSQKKTLEFVLASATVIGAYAALRGELLSFLAPLLGSKGSKLHLFVHNVWNGFIFTLAACAFYLTQKYYREELKHQQLQKELLLAELAFLKSQTNPHFLYNSLNFLYAQAISVSTPLSQSILLLSDILRYAIEDADAQGMVPLKKEVQHLENFIEMHRLRFQHNLLLDYTVKLPASDLERCYILPFVLISLVENAFKHGLFSKEPLLIRLVLQGTKLTFEVKNKIDRQSEKHQTPGVGLRNIKRMLDLAYPGTYTLDLREENDFFMANLALKITVK
jgi:two-component system, LytTR family, sensor kinase